MQEILNNTALYYNPLCENELTKVIKTFVTSFKLSTALFQIYRFLQSILAFWIVNDSSVSFDFKSSFLVY